MAGPAAGQAVHFAPAPQPRHCAAIVPDSPLEGTGFEPSVPPRKKGPWRAALRPTIVAARGDLCLMTPSSLSVRHLPSITAERRSQERDRWFESGSLLR